MKVRRAPALKFIDPQKSKSKATDFGIKSESAAL